MKNEKKRNAIGNLLVWSGLWIINILIVIFGLPFLIYKKMQEFCSPKSNLCHHPPYKTKKSNSASYLSGQIDSICRLID